MAIDVKIPFSEPFYVPFEDIEEEIRDVVEKRRFTRGNNLKKFEDGCASYLDVEHVIACGSATMGLFIGMKELSKFYSDHPIVVMPSFSFKSVPIACALAGWNVQFGDIYEDTWTLKDERYKEADLVMGMDTFGNRCELRGTWEDKVMDASQSFGTPGVGARANFEVFSLYGGKIIQTGEGGLVTTPDADLARGIRMYRDRLSRMPELSAILGNAMLDRIDEILAQKAHIAGIYRKRLPNYTFQAITDTNNYIVACLMDNREQRESVMDKFRNSIDFRKFYEPPLAFGECLPITEDISNRILCLPNPGSVNVSRVLTAISIGRVTNMYGDDEQ